MGEGGHDGERESESERWANKQGIDILKLKTISLAVFTRESSVPFIKCTQTLYSDI